MLSSLRSPHWLVSSILVSSPTLRTTTPRPVPCRERTPCPCHLSTILIFLDQNRAGACSGRRDRPLRFVTPCFGFSLLSYLPLLSSPTSHLSSCSCHLSPTVTTSHLSFTSHFRAHPFTSPSLRTSVLTPSPPVTSHFRAQPVTKQGPRNKKSRMHSHYATSFPSVTSSAPLASRFASQKRSLLSGAGLRKGKRSLLGVVFRGATVGAGLEPMNPELTPACISIHPPTTRDHLSRASESDDNARQLPANTPASTGKHQLALRYHTHHRAGNNKKSTRGPLYRRGVWLGGRINYLFSPQKKSGIYRGSARAVSSLYGITQVCASALGWS